MFFGTTYPCSPTGARATQLRFTELRRTSPRSRGAVGAPQGAGQRVSVDQAFAQRVARLRVMTLALRKARMLGRGGQPDLGSAGITIPRLAANGAQLLEPQLARGLPRKTTLAGAS